MYKVLKQFSALLCHIILCHAPCTAWAGYIPCVSMNTYLSLFQLTDIPYWPALTPGKYLYCAVPGVPNKLVSGSGVVFPGLKFELSSRIGVATGVSYYIPEAGAGINRVLIVLIGFL
jgi:hypothetical protein